MTQQILLVYVLNTIIWWYPQLTLPSNYNIAIKAITVSMNFFFLFLNFQKIDAANRERVTRHMV